MDKHNTEILSTYNNDIKHMVRADKNSSELEALKQHLSTSNINLPQPDTLHRSFDNEYVSHEHTLSDSSVYFNKHAFPKINESINVSKKGSLYLQSDNARDNINDTFDNISHLNLNKSKNSMRS